MEIHAHQIQNALQAIAYGMCAGHLQFIAETTTAIQESLGLVIATAALLITAGR